MSSSRSSSFSTAAARPLHAPLRSLGHHPRPGQWVVTHLRFLLMQHADWPSVFSCQGVPVSVPLVVLGMTRQRASHVMAHGFMDMRQDKGSRAVEAMPWQRTAMHPLLLKRRSLSTTVALALCACWVR